jgi:hypothetical protein
MHIPTSLNLALNLLLVVRQAQASVTVYNQIPLGQIRTQTASAAATTTLAAYSDMELVPPPLPTPLNTQFQVNLQRDAGNVPGLSIPHKTASFFGFSIEMSVINQVCEFS